MILCCVDTTWQLFFPHIACVILSRSKVKYSYIYIDLSLPPNNNAQVYSHNSSLVFSLFEFGLVLI